MSFSPFSTPQQQPQSLFQPQPQPFQQSSSLFPQQFQQQQQQQFPQQFQQPQQQQQHNQQQLYLFTNDKAPANYSTKWADLHPDSHKVLLQIEYVSLPVLIFLLFFLHFLFLVLMVAGLVRKNVGREEKRGEKLRV